MSPLTLLDQPRQRPDRAGALRRGDPATGAVEEAYTDYRRVNGIQVAVPHRRPARRAAPLIERDVEDRSASTSRCRRASSPSRADPPAVAERLRVMISCGEPSGDLYAGALASEILRLEPDAVITGFGGDRLRAAGATLVGDFKRPVGDRPHRGAPRASAIVAELPRAGARGGARRGPTSSSRSISRTSILFSRARCTSAACRSSTTSARSSGRGAAARMKTMKRLVGSRAGDLSVRGAVLREGRRPGHVRRPSAARADARRRAARDAFLRGARPRSRRGRSWRCCRAAGGNELRAHAARSGATPRR